MCTGLCAIGGRGGGGLRTGPGGPGGLRTGPGGPGGLSSKLLLLYFTLSSECLELGLLKKNLMITTTSTAVTAAVTIRVMKNVITTATATAERQKNFIRMLCLQN